MGFLVSLAGLAGVPPPSPTFVAFTLLTDNPTSHYEDPVKHGRRGSCILCSSSPRPEVNRSPR